MNCAAVGPDGRTVRFPALAELSGDFAPGGAWLGLRALGLALRAGDGRGPATVLRDRVAAQLGTPDPEAALTGIYTGTLPYARLFELARVLLDAAAEGDAPARQAADFLADEVAAFVRAAVVRLDLRDEAVEVVLGGGIFDTADAAFHARVADGIRAAAPRAVLVRLDAPPVLGAALIGLDAEDAPASSLTALRRALQHPEADTTAGPA
jgi:N-acetylglucosamine kinase-like BadF-type ATPase